MWLDLKSNRDSRNISCNPNTVLILMLRLKINLIFYCDIQGYPKNKIHIIVQCKGICIIKSGKYKMFLKPLIKIVLNLII